MTTFLTVDLVRENPWNIMTHPMPRIPSELLLEAAMIAADYCCRSARLFECAARDGDYRSGGWQPGVDPDAHEMEEDVWFNAMRRRETIRVLLQHFHNRDLDEEKATTTCEWDSDRLLRRWKR